MSLLDTDREPGNAPAAFLGFRRRVRPARRGGVVQRRSYSAEETAPELTVLRRSAARASPSMGNA